MLEDKLVSVIIISYNSQDFIKKCIESILKNMPGNGEVIVLDNASLDRTVEILKRFGNKIHLIESGENLGFAKGSNKAAQKAKGDYLFFLNPDTEMMNPSLEELVSFYKSHSNAGVVAPRLIMPGGKIQPSVKKLPTIWGALREYILGEKKAYSEYAPVRESAVEVEMVYGAAMLVKKDLFDSLGGFDERFFLYYEDADLCRRIHEIGQKVYYFPKVSIKHLVGGTKSSKDKYKLNRESAIKYHGFFKFMILQFIFRLHQLFS